MKASVLAAALVGLVSAGPVIAQVAGSTTPGGTTEDLKTVYTGWSVKEQIHDTAV